MRERIFVLLSLIIIVVALIGMNAVSYVRIQEEPDTEERPRRTTYNGGATGIKAFYDFLRESGRRVTRWQQKPSALHHENVNQPAVFVIVGQTKRQFEETEIRSILEWTAKGGKLVLVDRVPEPQLLQQTSDWKISAESKPIFLVGQASSDNVNEMTSGVQAAKPVQPSILTIGVNSVMPSKYASLIKVERPGAPKTASVIKATPAQRSIWDDDESPSPPKPVGAETEIESVETINPQFPVPLSLLASGEKTILVDYPYGNGRIVYLSDPYIISNNGIALVDNLQLAQNLVGNHGIIAFDEYHQGYGASGNALLNYFENTPIPAIAAQLALMILLLVYTKGRRFARPVPLPVPDRRSKLEYVAAVAELQRRARTYDLAIENIYNRVRRELARFAGVDNTTVSREELARRVAERSKINSVELETVMRDCENAIQGEKINDKKALALAAKLREFERELGLRKNAAALK